VSFLCQPFRPATQEPSTGFYHCCILMAGLGRSDGNGISPVQMLCYSAQSRSLRRAHERPIPRTPNLARNSDTTLRNRSSRPPPSRFRA
jgi:hypothetical protein